MEVSGFTFIHNGVEGGYPFVEAILAVYPFVDNVFVVDCESTDETRQVLEKLKEKLGIVILNGFWGNEAGKTLRDAHAHHVLCSGDIVLHFEADEVYDHNLLCAIKAHIDGGLYDLSVYRLQLEQNFQRCRWYPELVHRVFPKHSKTWKEGHTTDRHGLATEIDTSHGYLWDITNCFRDNWLQRVKNQAELRGEKDPCRIMAGVHILHEPEITVKTIDYRLKERHWTWTNTPFSIPQILRPLVGEVKYNPWRKLD